MHTKPRTVYLWPDDCPHNGNGHDRPHMVIYPPSRSSLSPTPAVIICPGGGYTKRADHEGEPLAKVMASHGMLGVVCHYRVAPNRHPAPYADAARTVRLVRSMSDELNVDPQRIVLMGFSAGGHNACTVATQPDLHHDEHDDLVDQFSARPDRLVLAYPVVSFITKPHRGSAQQLVGRDASHEVLQQFSGELHVDANTPPTFLFHTADDEPVPVENSLNFAAACREHDIPVEVHIYAHGPHGVGMALDHPALRSWTSLLLDWLADFCDDA